MEARSRLTEANRSGFVPVVDARRAIDLGGDPALRSWDQTETEHQCRYRQPGTAVGSDVVCGAGHHG